MVRLNYVDFLLFLEISTKGYSMGTPESLDKCTYLSLHLSHEYENTMLLQSVFYRMFTKPSGLGDFHEMNTLCAKLKFCK